MKVTHMLKSLINGLYSSIKRFPVALGLSTIATALLIILVHNEQSFRDELQELIGRIVMVLALGIPISLCLRLIFERKTDLPLISRIALYGAEALGLTLYYFFFLKDLSMVSVTRYVGLSVAFYLAFIYTAHFIRRQGFELYVIRLLTRFFTTVIYSVVLFLGIVAILFTIDQLLEIRVDERLYFEVWLTVVGVFATSFFLAGVPQKEEQHEIYYYPKLLTVLLLYIVMPILSVYTGILYIYFAKILVTLQWPMGLVAHLVLWYSVISAAVIFLISPLREESKWSRAFIFWIPKIIIPLIIMMFISIGIRVNAYGITENRYYVIALALWVFGVMLYLNIMKTKRNIILLVSLSLIAFLAVVGPWSSYSISKLSQNQRLEGILMKYSMISNNAIVKPTQGVTDYDKREISQILYYFSASHTLNDVKYLPKGFEMNQMENVFGFPYTELDLDYNNTGYFSYSSDRLNAPIDIRGYDYLFLANNYNPSDAVQEIEIKYDDRTQEVRINAGGNEVYRNSLEEFGKQLHKKYGTKDMYDIAADEMVLADENEHIKVKLVFNNINGYEEKTDKDVQITYMDFYVLIQLK